MPGSQFAKDREEEGEDNKKKGGKEDKDGEENEKKYRKERRP